MGWRHTGKAPLKIVLLRAASPVINKIAEGCANHAHNNEEPQHLPPSGPLLFVPFRHDAGRGQGKQIEKTLTGGLELPLENLMVESAPPSTPRSFIHSSAEFITIFHPRRKGLVYGPEKIFRIMGGQGRGQCQRLYGIVGSAASLGGAPLQQGIERSAQGINVAPRSRVFPAESLFRRRKAIRN